VPETRYATLEEEAEAWRARMQANEAREAQELKRERYREKLRADGWSDQAIEAYEADHPLTGIVQAFTDQLHPWGAPDHFSDRKSKRVRKDKPKPGFWYQIGGLPEDAQRPVGQRRRS
jgi:hypothetical protein